MSSIHSSTKTACAYSALSIFLIVLFVISPLSRIYGLALFMKCVILALLFYTIYLNARQTQHLAAAARHTPSDLMTVNLVCSCVFTLFLGLLVIFMLKQLFL